MQAVIRTGAHQYSVAPGATIDIEKIDGPVGSEIHFHDVLYFSDKGAVKTGPTAKGMVVGKITLQFRGTKVNVFKKKRRKGYKRTIGHRQPYTQVQITKIEV